jgi:hypothetical protein
MAAPVASVRETSGGDGTAIAVDPAGAGATVGDTTIGSPPPAPASGVQVTVDPGRGLPPITFVLP